jgi:hypothetical protein
MPDEDVKIPDGDIAPDEVKQDETVVPEEPEAPAPEPVVVA